MSIEQLALHEAAHAIVAERLGVPVEAVWIKGNRGACDLIAKPYRAYDDRVIKVAGYAGEALAGVLPGRSEVALLLGDDDPTLPMDIPEWLKLVAPAAPDLPEVIAWLKTDLARAIAILDPDDYAVSALRDELLRAGTVSGDDVRYLLLKHGGRGQSPKSPGKALARAAYYLAAPLLILWEDVADRRRSRARVA
jgi:hypothetical protein